MGRPTKARKVLTPGSNAHKNATPNFKSPRGRPAKPKENRAGTERKNNYRLDWLIVE